MAVRDLIELYLTEGPRTRLNKRESSWRVEASNLRQHVAPLIGDLALADVTRDHISRMIVNISEGLTAVRLRTGPQGSVKLRGGPGSARFVYRNTKTLFYWAIGRNLMSTNPATRVELPLAATVGRYLELDEAKRLLASLTRMEAAGTMNPQHGAALRLLLFTGARRSEICALRWAEIDVLHRQLVLPPERSKTGGKTGERRIPLSQMSIDILTSLPVLGPFVFPAQRQSKLGHMNGLPKSWRSVCADADLGRVRIHDLRHSFASLALANGENIISISKVLGHTSLRMTQRYLHVHDTAGVELSERTASLFA